VAIYSPQTGCLVEKEGNNSGASLNDNVPPDKFAMSETDSSNEQAPRGRPVWVTGLAFLFGAVFVFSALTKGYTIDEGKVRRSPFFELMLVTQTPLETRQQAALATRAIVAMELLIGLLFFQRALLRRVVVPITAFVLLGFTLYLLWLMIYDPEATDCGCFGEMIKMSPAVSILKNLVLLAVLVPVYRFADSAKRSMGIPIGMAAFALAFAIFAMPAPPAEPPAAPVKAGGAAPSKFAIFDTLRNGEEELDLTEGLRIAAFLSLDCEHCQFVALQLGETYDIFEPARIGFVFLGKEEQVSEFLGQINTDLVIPYTIPSALSFFDFTGDQPPRVYLLNQGEIVEYWDLDAFDLDQVEAAVRALAPLSKADPGPSDDEPEN
jgi:hypothetical protein